MVIGATEEIYRKWRSLASKKLSSTRRLYVNGLVIVDEGRLKSSIVLKGKLPNMIENGISAYDMKIGFSKSGKIKRNKDGGWYLTIPFRHAASTSLGENEAFSTKLPKEVHSVAKSGRAVRLQDLPAALQTKKTNSKGYTHKSAIYEGLKRQTDDQGRTSGYSTFRRVGSNSPKNSWINKGMPPRNFASKALSDPSVKIVVDNIIDDFINDI